MHRGYFGIGVVNLKYECNIGTLMRSAHSMGACFVFVVGRRYKQQASDTTKAWRHLPLYHYLSVDDLVAGLPYDCRIVGVEFPHDKARPLGNYVHPERCVYLLGAEDNGLTGKALSLCHELIYIPCHECLNVSVAGSIVLYDRVNKRGSFSIRGGAGDE